MSFQQNATETPSARPRNRRGSWLRSLLPQSKLWLVAVLVFGGDQLVKAVVVANLARGESWPVDGFVRITHVWNTGSAFSLLRDQNGLMTIVSLGATVLLVFYLRSSGIESRLARFGLALALGGAAGNIFDRIRLGHVTDMFDIGRWPIFNTADSAILVGFVLIFWNLWPSGKSDDSEQTDNVEPEDSVAEEPQFPKVAMTIDREQPDKI